jgi:hypothetical protein
VYHFVTILLTLRILCQAERALQEEGTPEVSDAALSAAVVTEASSATLDPVNGFAPNENPRTRTWVVGTGDDGCGERHYGFSGEAESQMILKRHLLGETQTPVKIVSLSSKVSPAISSLVRECLVLPTFAMLVSKTVPRDPDYKRPLPQVQAGEDGDENGMTEFVRDEHDSVKQHFFEPEDSVANEPPLLEEKFQIQLVQSPKWESPLEIHDLLPGEYGLCLEALTLQDTRTNTSDEMSSGTQTLKMFLAVGTGDVTNDGEGDACNGRLLFYEVDSGQYQKKSGNGQETRARLRLVFTKAMKAPITAICQMHNYLAACCGRQGQNSRFCFVCIFHVSILFALF